MGCAIRYEYIGIKMGSQSPKFNGIMLKFAREFEGYTLEDFAQLTGKRYAHWLEIEEGLTQPLEEDIDCILEAIPSFLQSFYYCETYIKEKPDMIFMCGKGIVACSNCGQVADYLCDYPVGEGKTCDLPICQNCRTHVGKYDFCPIHYEVNKGISVIQQSKDN